MSKFVHDAAADDDKDDAIARAIPPKTAELKMNFIRIWTNEPFLRTFSCRFFFHKFCKFEFKYGPR